jgi:hypothetical protein
MEYEFYLLSIIEAKNVRYALDYVRPSARGLMRWPASALLGPPDLEPGAALARILGFPQVNRTPKPFPASGRNPPQADSEKYEKHKCYL